MLKKCERIRYAQTKEKILMAIFHMSFNNISNGKGRGAIASASYRSGERLYDEKEGRNYFYERSVKPETFILKPDYAPEWCLDRERLWNEVEKRENKVNSRYAKEFNVALPIELSEEEQKELLLNYVQQNFVDDGMVADIAIHRDHEQNPHAHVMLTNRPFNQDGTWGQKSKHEYILDRNGNKTYTPNGNVRNRKIWLVDWDKREKMEEWRSSWAEAVNEQLEKKGLSERISHKSFERQGINQEPTIHVGVKKSKQRIAYNEAVKSKQKADQRLEETERKAKDNRHRNKLNNFLSYAEKHQIADLSKALKTYVDFENINDKRRMLENWKNSVLVKKIMGMDIVRQIALINKTELNVNEANELLDKVANRMIKKLYPQLEKSNMSKYEKRELIEETVKDDHVYQGKELADKMEDIREYLLDKRVTTFVRRPMVNLRLLEKWNESNYQKLNGLLDGYDVTSDELIKGDKTDELNRMEEKTKKKIGKLVKNIRSNDYMEAIINTQYKAVLGMAFPKIDQERLSIKDKEKLYMHAMYYDPALKPYSTTEIKEIVQQAKLKFTHEEHEIGLEYLDGKRKIETITNKHLKSVLQHQGMKQMFIYECREDQKLDQDKVSKIRKKFMANEDYLDNQRGTTFSDYKALGYSDYTATEYNQTTFSDQIINDLMREDYSKYEEEHRKAEERKLEREMTRKQRKGKGKGRRKDSFTPHL